MTTTSALTESSTVLEALALHQKAMANERVSTLFERNPDRFKQMSCTAAGITLDYSKNIATPVTMRLLQRLTEECQLEPAIEAMMSGKRVNCTEKRQALHTVLRSASDTGGYYVSQVNETLEKMQRFVESIHQGQWRGATGKPITHVVNIGIGGSDLGPLMVTEALTPFSIEGIHCQFVSNVDASAICDCLKGLDPASTLFIVASKTFTTTETLANAQTARRWLISALGEAAVEQHFVAVTAHIDNAVNFGIAGNNIFPTWEWVGGRYSLWSAIGLPIALAIGMEGFNQLRAGANEMDRHFAEASFERNLPVILALLGVWYINFWDAQSHAVLPYDHYLRSFSKYLQQLDMESNGKGASIKGGYVSGQTGPVIWGDVGTNGQHSFHQLLHQGTRLIPVDFIVPLSSHNPVGDHHGLLFANCLSQSRALMMGKSLEQAKAEFMVMGYAEAEAETLAPHKTMPGNRPSNTLIIDKLTPKTLGALIALYEHKVYVQSVIWGVNAFDQWGVELGKQLCTDIFTELHQQGRRQAFDASTEGLMALYQPGAAKA